MGNEVPHAMDKIIKGLEKDGHTVLGTFTHARGFAVKARSNFKNPIAYVKGDPFEMGFLTGRMYHKELEMTCSEYVKFIIPQFINEDFDIVMQEAPVVFSIIYENILNWITNVFISESVAAFDESVKRGDIPMYIVQEIDGLVKGASSMRAFTNVSRARLIAANFGLDYLFSQILSGKLFARLSKFLQQFPVELQLDAKKILALPEMCNLVMASRSATLSGKDAYMMRDFQFANGRVYHKNCMILIRDGRDHGRSLNSSVILPGFIGAITGLNSYGLACGMNMVRSEAVDTERIGCGIMMMIRSVLDYSKNVQDMEKQIRSMYTGMPWITYGLDSTGEQRVFELIGRSVPLTMERWRPRFTVPAEIIAALNLDKWNTGSDGVWPRTGYHHKGGEGEIDAANLKLFRYFHLSKPSVPMFKSFEDEYSTKVGNAYFVRWRPHPDVTIATNTFLNPILRRTEMTARMKVLYSNTPTTTWRYDKLVEILEHQHGKITIAECRNIVSFLSPQNEPKYVSNQRKFDHYAKLVGGTYNKDETITISGSLSVIDIQALRLENKAGSWKNEFFGVSLKNYI